MHKPLLVHYTDLASRQKSQFINEVERGSEIIRQIVWELSHNPRKDVKSMPERETYLVVRDVPVEGIRIRYVYHVADNAVLVKKFGWESLLPF